MGCGLRGTSDPRTLRDVDDSLRASSPSCSLTNKGPGGRLQWPHLDLWHPLSVRSGPSHTLDMMVILCALG